LITNEIKTAFDAFQRGGNIVSVKQFTAGLINATYLIETDKTEKYILQKINTFVFKKPDELMFNIVGVTKHITEKIKENGGDYKRENLNFLPCDNGEYYFRDENNGAWRLYIYVDEALTYNKPKNDDTFRNAGRSFGRFMKLLDGYPADTLHETIKNFHYTPARYENFLRAVEADIKGRKAVCEDEIQFVIDRKADTHKLTDLITEGVLPLRVTHNDTKLNNVLFDIKTDKGICVIDLDTIMPGLSLYDFGDSIRSGANTAAEDEADLSKVGIDLNLFEVYVDGFLSETAESLNDAEIENLAYGAKLMTFECGIRFLTDYLEGDVYFRTTHPEHNIIRARNQFKLVADMEAHMDEMNAIVMKYKKKYTK
jgi:hypothetical protein